MPGPSGNIANALNDIIDNYDTVTNVISDIAGALADSSGAIGPFINLVETLLDQGRPNEVLTKLDAIQTAIRDNFHALNADEAANQILTRNTTLTGFIDQSHERFQSLKAKINAHPSPSEVADYIGPCIKALDDLSGGPPEGPITFAWNMNFDWQIYWTDAGQYFVHDAQGHTYDVGYKLQAPQPNPDGVTVFVYTYSLPLYLYAVAIFLAVAGSLDPNFIANYGDTVLRPAAALLRSKLEKIVQDGLKSLSPYDWTEDAEGSPTLAAPGWRSDGGASIIEYGAVERFSGYSSIGANYWLGPVSSNLEISWIFKKLQLRVLKRTKDVYFGVGLSRVRELINKLTALVGDPPLPYPNLVDWSLRECVRAVKSERLGWPPAGDIYLRDLAHFIITTQPHDTPYPVNPPWPSLSFRALLTNFND